MGVFNNEFSHVEKYFLYASVINGILVLSRNELIILQQVVVVQTICSQFWQQKFPQMKVQSSCFCFICVLSFILVSSASTPVREPTFW